MRLPQEFKACETAEIMRMSGLKQNGEIAIARAGASARISEEKLRIAHARVKAQESALHACWRRPAKDVKALKSAGLEGFSVAPSFVQRENAKPQTPF